MPQNVIDADLYTAVVQTAANGDLVDGASRLMEAQDLADRTRYLNQKRWLLAYPLVSLSIGPNDPVADPPPTNVAENVVPLAWSTAASIYITTPPLEAADIVHIQGNVGVRGFGTDVYFKFGDPVGGGGQFPGTCYVARNSGAIPFNNMMVAVDAYWQVPAPIVGARVAIYNMNIGTTLDILDIWQLAVKVYRT